MKKILFYLYDGLTDFELTLPSLVVKNYLGYDVVTFSYDKKEVTSLSGLTYVAEYNIESVLEMKDIDGIVMPGGVNLKFYKSLTTLLKNLDKKKALIAAICAGPQFLAEAGLLNNIPFTVSESKETLKEQGYVDHFNWDYYKEERVVRSGHILTAKGDAFVRFSGEILVYFDEESYAVQEFVDAFCEGNN